MKTLYYLPPAAAIAILGIWLGGQQGELTALEERVILLKKNLAAGPILPEETVLSLNARVKAKANKSQFIKSDGEIDWLAVGEEMQEMIKSGGMGGNMQAYMELQALMQKMDGEELAAAMTTVKAAGMTKEVEEGLLNALQMVLMNKDPEKLLSMEVDALSGDRSSWQLRNAFESWVGKDMAAATAWFDQKVVEGKFETKSLDPTQSLRYDFEAKLLGILMKDDMGKVKARLGKMSEEQRAILFRQSDSWNVNSENLLSYTGLIREMADEKERASIVGDAIAKMANQGDKLKTVGEWMEKIDATPEEREKIIDGAVQRSFYAMNPGKETVTTVRDWVAEVAPERVPQMTAKALNSLMDRGGENGFDSAKEMIKEMKDDRVTVEFAKNLNRRHSSDRAGEILQMINDEDLRMEVLQQFVDEKGEEVKVEISR